MTRVDALWLAAMVTLAAAGCSDPSAPTAPTRPAMLPKNPARVVFGEPRTKVLYSARDGDSTIIETGSISAAGGQVVGNTAFVDGGTEIRVSGTFTVRSSSCDDICLWIPYIGLSFPLDGGPDVHPAPNAPLATSIPGYPFTGTFEWTTKAPLYPGRYGIGAAQTLGDLDRFDRPEVGFDLTVPDLETQNYYSWIVDVNEPAIIPVLDGAAANAAGWYTGDVSLSWDVAVIDAVVQKKLGCDPVAITADTPGQVITCKVEYSINEIGAERSNSVTIKRDATPPTVTILDTRPIPTPFGWNNTNVTVAFQCEDLTSLPTNPAVQGRLVTAEGANQSVEMACADKAGNTATKTQAGINIDKTPPTLAPTLPSTELLLNAVVEATPNATDALSGIAAATCNPVDTRQAGSFSVLCIAADKAGNEATATVSYTVKSPYAFSGFLAPIVAPPAINAVQAGSSVPVKFSVGGNKGLAILAAGFPTSTSVACAASTRVATITESSASKAGSSGLTYDPATDTYTYLWKTEKSWANTCRTFVLKLTDGVERTARFQFKK